MLTVIPHQWKAVVLESVGINEFTDMYVQGILTYVKYDMLPHEVSPIEFDTILTDELLEDMIIDLKMFVVQHHEQLKDILITYQISLVRAVLIGIDIGKDLRHVNFLELEKEIEKIKREQWAATERILAIDDDNIIKIACQELNIPKKELAIKLGIEEDTIKEWSSTNELPKWALNFIELMIENEENNTIKLKLKELIKLINK